MRPVSDVAKALLRAACELSAAGRGVTLAEMAAGACVGQQAARDTVPKLKRRGQLKIVGQRRVDYRNRPVAEYAPVQAEAAGEPRPRDGIADLAHCLQAWAR
jgi:hypothetical protein